jgi:hypothetical protein
MSLAKSLASPLAKPIARSVTGAGSGVSTPAAPVNTVAPVTNGTTTVGSVLSCTEGTWTGTPTPAFTYQWYADDVLIVGETANTYTIPIDDVGAMLECRVTGTNAAGSDVGISNEVGPVTNPPSGVGVMVIGSDFTVS